MSGLRLVCALAVTSCSRARMRDATILGAGSEGSGLSGLVCRGLALGLTSHLALELL